jgi:uncharacterized repeat protein (TIGR03803 family)
MGNPGLDMFTSVGRIALLSAASLTLATLAVAPAASATRLAESTQPFRIAGVGADARQQTVDTVLYKFHDRNDGATPYGGLMAGADGALYGTTCIGGSYGDGTVFRLTLSGTHYVETTLHAFRGGPDGSCPMAALITDATGALYGTTSGGGSTKCSGGCGTVFKMLGGKEGYTETVIFRFSGRDGEYSISGLASDECPTA